MDTNNNTFSGFEAIPDFLSKPRGPRDDDDFGDIPYKDPSELQEGGEETEKETTEVSKKPVVEKTNTSIDLKLPDRSAPVIENKSVKDILEDDGTLEESVEVEDKEGSTENTSSETTDYDLKEAEPEVAAFLQERLYEKLGWAFEEGEEKLQSIDAVVDYMQSLVEENSKPEFASSEIEELNNFVADGGNVKNYFETKYAGNFDIESADIEDPLVQARVIKELYKEQGHTEDKIKKRLERLEDTGMLEEEARDSKEILVEMREKKAKKLLVEQQNLQKEAEKQQQKLYEDVANSIRSTKEILGVPISQIEKEKLIKDIFIPGQDGRTNYQRKYQSSIDNLIKSAFFTMYEDKLAQKVNTKATSEAATSLKKKLQTVKSGLRSKGSDTEYSETTTKKGSTDAFNAITSYLGR